MKSRPQTQKSETIVSPPRQNSDILPDLATEPRPYYYDGRFSALAVTMGLSRRWSDTYGANTVGQYLDITGLADGRYRLRVKADGDSADGSDRFLESDETNNSTWADLQITGDTVTVLAYGPSAPPVR